jgi:predicted enzyme related to lactoylglutathione lyase
MARPAYGSIGWVDLTVADAPKLRDFYQKVAGWQPQPVHMSGYEDFSMLSESGEAVAGVCHARGANAKLPPVWMIYIVVENLELALQHCRNLGGKVVSPVRMAGGSRYAVIQDPADAFVALWEPGEAA